MNGRLAFRPPHGDRVAEHGFALVDRAGELLEDPGDGADRAVGIDDAGHCNPRIDFLAGHGREEPAGDTLTAVRIPRWVSWARRARRRLLARESGEPKSATNLGLSSRVEREFCPECGLARVSELICVRCNAFLDGPSTTEERVKALFPDIDFPVRYRPEFGRREVAANPATRSEALAILAEDPDWTVRQAVASNPSVSTETLGRLSRDPTAPVRAAVAASARTPRVALEQLAGDDDASVRGAVASEEMATPAMLDDALDPHDAPTRAIVARHRNTSSGTVDQLSKDEDASVRAAIAGRADLGSELRALLVHDQDPAVRTAVAARRDLAAAERARLRDDPVASVRAVLAGNPTSPTEILGDLATDPDTSVRAAVAVNPASPIPWAMTTTPRGGLSGDQW